MTRKKVSNWPILRSRSAALNAVAQKNSEQAVKQKNIEELQQEIASLRKQVESLEDRVNSEKLSQQVEKWRTDVSFLNADIVTTKGLLVNNNEGNAVITAQITDNENGLLTVANKSGKEVLQAGVETRTQNGTRLRVQNRATLD